MTLLSDDSERITKGEEIIISHKKEISNYICELWRDELKSKKKRTHEYGQHCGDYGRSVGGDERVYGEINGEEIMSFIF